MNAYDVWLHLPANLGENNDFSKPPTFNLSQYFPCKKIISFGLKKSLIFYAEYNFEKDVYFTPLCTVSWRTVFEDNVPKYQIKRTSWLILGEFKPVSEMTTKIEQPKVFLQKMRSRVIEELVDLADKFELADKLKALYEKHSTEIYIYKEGGSPKFRNVIYESQEEWLTRDSTDGRTIRDLVMQYLSIGVVEG